MSSDLFAQVGRGLDVSEFGSLTFNVKVMEQLLPKETFAHLKECLNGKVKLHPKHVGAVAEVMKEWAMSKGVTYFCHWFQPMTGYAAEKQDAFFDWKTIGSPIETFSHKALLRGEPDASSFPSGGLRNTSQARGYTAWDPTSYPFIWTGGECPVLCIPAVFFSWKGDALDMKIPLLRSEAKVVAAGERLLNLLGITGQTVFSTLGCEQEYFLIDRSFYLERPDLMMVGRTVCGAPSPKGQELEDHYFSAMKERVATFLLDLEREAFALGIPLKTRHGEVAPHQFEVAPLFEKVSLAVDHNVLLMELLRQVAERHDLACLLHEKPFARINGSGKHCNWSLGSDKGLNFLSPDALQTHPWLFLITLTATLHAVNEHGALLRASIGSAANDHRLGGHEAPPPIISVYLGEHLEKWLTSFEENKARSQESGKTLDLRIPALSDLEMDHTDRNRTSPFAFTGNKFEFRAVGSSQNTALPMTVLNAIVASSLNEIIDSLEAGIVKGKKLEDVAPEIMRSYLKKTRKIRFCGDNYSKEWKAEAKARKLPAIEKSLDSFPVFLSPKSTQAFEGVLMKREIESRVEIFTERYTKIAQIESLLLIDLFQTQILPAALQYQKQMAKSIKVTGEVLGKKSALQKGLLQTLSSQIDESIKRITELQKTHVKAASLPLEKKAELFCHDVSMKREKAREAIDILETLISDELFPLPKYREMLTIL